jgi:DNA-binding transcriptional MerR regulator
MSYTVNKLAKLSGVSVRTLHFYDQIGLLKPAYYGENNYRYYEEEQLLLLQQILFYRELGFPLNEIREFLRNESFDKIKALTSHREILIKNLDRTQDLIKTIDDTIKHLRGDLTMKPKELYYGFDSEKQKEHEKYLVEQGIVTQEFLDESHKKIKNWTDAEKNAFILEGEEIMKALIKALENNLSPSSDEVQTIMRQHYAWLERSWTPTKEKYLGLIDLYETPHFRIFFDERHPKLLAFIQNAMRVFADK